jgi:hypothetical protein
MTIEAIRPKSRRAWLALRKGFVGASEISALFGVSPHTTPFQLFAAKRGEFEHEFAEVELRADSIHLPPIECGNLFEPAAFELTKRLRPKWKVKANRIPGGEMFVDRDARMSSTPDAFLFDPDRPYKRGTIQVKSLTDRMFREGSSTSEPWLQPDDSIVPPIAVAIQAIADGTLAGCDFVYAGAFVTGYGVDFHLVEVPLHAALMVKARELVRDFWRRVEVNEPYPPDFARDGEALRAVYRRDDGSLRDLSGNERIEALIAERDALTAREADGSTARRARQAIDAELIFALGNSTSGLIADGRIIEAKSRRVEGHFVGASISRTVRIAENGYATGTGRRAGDRRQPKPADDSRAPY